MVKRLIVTHYIQQALLLSIAATGLARSATFGVEIQPRISQWPHTTESARDVLASEIQRQSPDDNAAGARVADIGEEWQESQELLLRGEYRNAEKIAWKTCPKMPIDSHGKAIKAVMCWLLIGRARMEMGKYAEAQSFLIPSMRIYEAIPVDIKKQMPDGDRLQIIIAEELASAYLGQGLEEEAKKILNGITKSRVSDSTTPKWRLLTQEMNKALLNCDTARKCIRESEAFAAIINKALAEARGDEDQEGNLRHALFGARLNIVRNLNALSQSREALAMIKIIEESNPQETGQHTKDLLLEKAIALNGENRFTQTIALLRPELFGDNTVRERELSLALYLELAHAHVAIGDEDSAEDSAIQAIKLKNNIVQEVTQTLPASERHQYLETLASLEGIYSYALKSKAGVRLALLARLNENKLVTEVDKRQSSIANERAFARQGASGTRSLSSTGTSIIEANAHRQNAIKAAIRRNFAPKDIVTPDAISEYLPEESILVEYKRYFPFNATQPLDSRWEAPRYMAMVIRGKSDFSAIDLGPTEHIDMLISEALTSSEENRIDSAAKWEEISRLVLAPIIPSAIDPKRILVSPDGELNRIPFGAMALLSNYTVPISVISTGRSLPEVTAPPLPKRNEPLILASPDFSETTSASNQLVDAYGREEKLAPLQSQSHRGELLSRLSWKPLPGAEKEGRLVQSIIGGRLVIGKSANKKALMGANSPAILHIATHSYFRPDSIPSAHHAGLNDAQRNQSLQSGLVLSSGIERGSTSPSVSGYVTAEDVSSLPLQSTELVVVSGCQSGLGSIKVGEGVYGLARGFYVAGTKSTLLTLWKIDDTATAEFMRNFYRRIKAGESRADALIKTQKDFMAGTIGNGRWTDPYYWAAWQLVGDWRPILGL